MHIHIKLVNGEEILETIDKDSFIIGRSSKADIVVPHEGMSRQHCQIEYQNGDIYVTDLGSTNGVLIDGHKIEPHKKVLYQTYLSLSFGAVQSLHIETEDTTKPHLNTPMSKNQGSSNTRTITRTMQESLKKEAEATTTKAAPKNATSREDKIKSIFVNLLAALILGGAIYWYMQKDADAPSEDVNQDTHESQPNESYDRF